MRKTMEQRIFDYMAEFGSITTFEAFTELGCSRLSEYIRRLRLTNNIEDEWIHKINRYGDKVQFKKYRLVKE